MFFVSIVARILGFNGIAVVTAEIANVFFHIHRAVRHFPDNGGAETSSQRTSMEIAAESSLLEWWTALLLQIFNVPK